MSCPACLSPKVDLLERVSVQELAASWARAGVHASGTTPDAIHDYVREDLGADDVSMLSCHACGMEFADPRKTWRPDHYPGEAHGLGWDHDQALTVLSTLPRGALLDVGCADGQFLEKAAALGYRVTGMDFSSEDVDAARRRGVDAFVGDLSREGNLAFGNRRFDTITMFQVIEHLEELEAVFAQLARLATPDATLMIGCPSPRRYTRAWAHADRIGHSDYWDYPPQHSLRWSAQALRAFLTRQGWSVSSIAHEPLEWIGAAAHLTALSGGRSTWYASPVRRRMHTLGWLTRIAWRQARTPATGIRLFACATRTEVNPIS